MAKNKKKKKKRRRKTGKGPSFERDICKKLSKWWSNGSREDIFWRTSGSGARAKTRSKSGKRTFGQYGDVQATDPIGQPLIDLCNIEIKRGYNSATVNDFIDSSKKKPEIEKFIEQTITDCGLRSDGSEWILLVKRDYKDIVLFTSEFFIKCVSPSMFKTAPRFPIVRMRVKIKKRWMRIVAIRLDDFFQQVTPAMIKKVWKWKMENE